MYFLDDNTVLQANYFNEVIDVLNIVSGFKGALTLVRMGNVFTATQKRQAFTESLGRIAGVLSLLLIIPKLR